MKSMTRVQLLFVENLKRERKQAGYSQEKLAELIGLTPKYISSIEIGNRFPSADTIQKIVDIFDLEPYQMFLNTELPDRSADTELLKAFKDYLAEDIPLYLKDVVKKYIGQTNSTQ